jgi:steroid delta-isomerase-like uncharacterized protein
MTTKQQEQQQLLQEKRDSIVKKLIEAENRHDVNAAIDAFHTPRYVVLPTEMEHDGRQAVGELLSDVFKAFPDFAIEIIKTYHSDDAVILEAKMKGTHIGEWAGFKSTGRKIVILTAFIFEFDKDQLVCGQVYYDMHSLVNQLSMSK